MGAPRVGWLLAICALVPGYTLAQGLDTVALATHLRAVRGVDSIKNPRFPELRREMMRWVDLRVLRGDPVSQINQELRSNNLLYKTAKPTFVPGSDTTVTGYVDQVTVQEAPGADDLLVIRFGVGMDCGYDQSAIVYRRTPLARLGWIESPSTGAPMNFTSVSVGEEFEGQRLLATESYGAWCSSSFTGIRLEIWRIASSGSMHALLIRPDIEGRRWFDNLVTTHVEKNIVTFRYTGDLPEISILVHAAIERYRVDGDKVTRIAPLALDLVGFIDEWMRMDDVQAAQWSEAAAARLHHELAAWYGKGVDLPFARSAVGQTAVRRCEGSPRIWEVALQGMDRSDQRHFQISEMGAENLRILQVSRTLSSRCPTVRVDLQKELPAN